MSVFMKDTEDTLDPPLGIASFLFLNNQNKSKRGKKKVLLFPYSTIPVLLLLYYYIPVMLFPYSTFSLFFYFRILLILYSKGASISVFYTQNEFYSVFSTK